MSNSAKKEELEAGRGYEALFVPALFKPWTHHLVDGANVAEGHDVLDVACGSGVLTRHVKSKTGPNGRVVGIDPAPGMIAAAAEIDPSVEWVLGSAEDLPFEDDTFDCVVSQFGMMFFQDKKEAASQMLRVIKPGGHLAVAVWNSLDNNQAYGDIIAVLDEEVSTQAGDALRLPYSLGDAGAVVSVFESEGFETAKFETCTEQARFPSSRTMVEAELRGWLPLFGINLTEDKIAEVLVQSDGRLAAYASEAGEAVFPTSAHIITAKKPS